MTKLLDCDKMPRKLLDDLLYYPGQTLGGQLPPADFWTSVDMLREQQEMLKKYSPSDELLVSRLYESAMVNLYSRSQEVWKIFRKTMGLGKVAVFHAHGGRNWPGQKGQWGYTVGNGEHPLVADLFAELDTMGFDLILLSCCNTNTERLVPKYTPVIHTIKINEDNPFEYILVRPGEST